MSNKKAYQGMFLDTLLFQYSYPIGKIYHRFLMKTGHFLPVSARFVANSLCHHNGIMQLIHKIPYTDEVLTEGFYPIVTIQWRLVD